MKGEEERGTGGGGGREGGWGGERGAGLNGIEHSRNRLESQVLDRTQNIKS